MQLHFYKYQATGNDFILLDCRQKNFDLNQEQIQNLCHRHYGIGSDGLIILKNTPLADFEMLFFNPDGSSGMMCGNGARASAMFAYDNKVVNHPVMSFLSPDGMHFAKVQDKGIVSLKMNSVTNYKLMKDGIWIDTGTSHFVKQVKQLKTLDVKQEGLHLRKDKRFSFVNGANIDFYKPKKKNTIEIRTYERGVEDETLSCGTGIVASALVYSINENLKDDKHSIIVESHNNILKVDFIKQNNSFTNIVLTGEAKKVFEGDIDI